VGGRQVEGAEARGREVRDLMKDIFCYEMMRGGWKGEREKEDERTESSVQTEQGRALSQAFAVVD
jgi:hypothetical protein